MIPSVLPPRGYGNHSCQDCRAYSNCPITGYVASDYGGADKPNQCSFYWPPNTPNGWNPSTRYWSELHRIKQDREGNG